MSTQININGEVKDITGLSVPTNRDFRAAWQFEGTAIEIDLEKAKPIARQKVNEHRDNKKTQPFHVPGLGDFSADPDSKDNIDGAAQAALMAKLAGQPFSVTWTLDDGTPIALDADQMQAVGLALMTHIDAAYTYAKTKKTEIENASTFAEVETILATL